ncbi:11557_t:CDS:1 [Funneliformis mosseae]|uniref:11557_t:CDS:1 n=1 Tax=Funneliformis mosseae TaxID=27381 RepID=A0A9N9I1F4_FUNMO|nr:11557_t:CDS:1 [Funneliformis mosseae]
MIFRCKHCEGEFCYCVSLQNYIKTHDNAIDKILHKISKESIQLKQFRNIERNDKKKTKKVKNEMSYDYENQLGEELVNIYEKNIFERELASICEEELVNTNDDDN